MAGMCFDFPMLQGWFADGAFMVMTALLLAVVAFMVAYFAQAGMDKLVVRWKDKLGEATVLPGQLVYLLVLLLFAPGIFERLGVRSVTAPIVQSMQEIFLFVPNLIGAVLVLVIGSMVAKMVRSLVNACLLKVTLLRDVLKLEQEKAADWFSSFIYILIMFPVAIAALEVLKLDALTRPAVGILTKCLLFIPNIFVSLLLLGIGMVMASFIAGLLKKTIQVSGIENKVSDLTGYPNFSVIVSSVVSGVIVLFFVVEALDVLNLRVLSQVGSAIIGYLPNLIGAIVIMVVAFFGVSALKMSMEKHEMGCCGRILEWVIYILAGFMTLNQLGLSRVIVNTAFTCIMVGITFALAVAFGFGGKEAAGKWLEQILVKKGLSGCCMSEPDASSEQSDVK